jgi:hypothetical protein
MPDDILEPPVSRSDPPARTPGLPRKVICQFCECELAIDGMVLKGSDKAKKLRKAEEEIEERERLIATLRSEITDLKARVAPANADSARGARGLTF